MDSLSTINERKGRKEKVEIYYAIKLQNLRAYIKQHIKHHFQNTKENYIKNMIYYSEMKKLQDEYFQYKKWLFSSFSTYPFRFCVIEKTTGIWQVQICIFVC